MRLALLWLTSQPRPVEQPSLPHPPDHCSNITLPIKNIAVSFYSMASVIKTSFKSRPGLGAVCLDKSERGIVQEWAKEQGNVRNIAGGISEYLAVLSVVECSTRAVLQLCLPSTLPIFAPPPPHPLILYQQLGLPLKKKQSKKPRTRTVFSSSSKDTMYQVVVRNLPYRVSEADVRVLFSLAEAWRGIYVKNAATTTQKTRSASKTSRGGGAKDVDNKAERKDKRRRACGQGAALRLHPNELPQERLASQRVVAGPRLCPQAAPPSVVVTISTESIQETRKYQQKRLTLVETLACWAMEIQLQNYRPWSKNVSIQNLLPRRGLGGQAELGNEVFIIGMLIPNQDRDPDETIPLMSRSPLDIATDPR
ncbi:hypothetical protein BDK51DRAFT_27280 [Blyttiomyces helicus]|uniref:Uncharacterized protein n=1 Tax=Blyttiomyces helicus TaxID=388810 RepID=A0A4V1IS10_9FUNG|nr:hypothetical protein BDK51DRAFT_27280 [Blyttiomyces helicus]|eukprot:RKO91927.1 hypothetical protein BDK51DRAFT_27280 [Blyttiomyces helicus]